MLLTGLLSGPYSATFLIDPRTFPGVAPPTVDWALPLESLMKKMHCPHPTHPYLLTGQYSGGIFSVKVSPAD